CNKNKNLFCSDGGSRRLAFFHNIEPIRTKAKSTTTNPIVQAFKIDSSALIAFKIKRMATICATIAPIHNKAANMRNCVAFPFASADATNCFGSVIVLKCYCLSYKNKYSDKIFYNFLNL